MTRSLRHRGFTIVELMMAVTIFSIGMTGIIALQQVTVVANKHSKNLAIASHIAAAWLDQLGADAALWDLAGRANTAWLNVAPTAVGVWTRPIWNDGRLFGAAFDAQGNPLPDASAAQAAFCTNIAVTPLYPSNGPNGVIRVEVRVFWFRDSGAPNAGRAFCGNSGDAVAAALAITTLAAADPNIYHFVHETTAVRQQP